MLVAVTPFCGAVFDCGCTWPWLGLDEKCNFYRQQLIDTCPWCRSIIAGGLSVGLALLAGVLAPWSPLPQAHFRTSIEAAIRILLGMLAFSAIALISAVLSAEWFHYPSPAMFLR